MKNNTTKVWYNAEYLVEHDRLTAKHQTLTITRAQDILSATFACPKLAGEFGDCVAKFGLERSLSTYLKLVDRYAGGWNRIYAPRIKFDDVCRRAVECAA